MEEGQPSLPRSRISVKFFVKICFRLYERRTCPPWRDLAIREFKLRVYELRQTAKLVLFPEFLLPLIIFCLAFSRYVIYFML